MAIIKLVDLISCSSQAKGYGAENLMYYHLKKAWKSSADDMSRQIEAEFQLHKASQIDFIDIGNNGSSTLEVQVGRSSSPTKYVTLLPAVTMLTFADLKGEVDKEAVYMFKEGNMVQNVAEQKWDRVKVICRQPYSKKFQFGLKFLILRTKNDWEIQSNDENQDLFMEEKSHYSMTPRRLSDVPNKIISRGQKLVQASKARHLLREKEDDFKEDVRIFLIACSDEVFKGLSSDGCRAEFEGQRQQKLCPKEKLLFQNVYHEFKVSDSEKDSSTISFSMDDISSEEESFLPLGVIKNNSTDMSNKNVPGLDRVNRSISLYDPLKSVSSFKLNSDGPNKSSFYEYEANITSEAIHEKDHQVPSDILPEDDSLIYLGEIRKNSTDKSNINVPGLDIVNRPNNSISTSVSSFKLNTDRPTKSSLHKFDANITSEAAKFPVHTSVSSLRSQQNLSDVCKTVKMHPKYRHKESTSSKSVSKSPKLSNLHSSVKRHSEDSWDSGPVSRKPKHLQEFPTRSRESSYRPEDFIQSDGSQPSTSKGFTLVDCPICLESFHPSAIEKHAATCGENEDSESPELTETCPFCADKFPSSEVGLHIENCFRYH